LTAFLEILTLDYFGRVVARARFVGVQLFRALGRARLVDVKSILSEIVA
jgi:hypothetical protein